MRQKPCLWLHSLGIEMWEPVARLQFVDLDSFSYCRRICERTHSARVWKMVGHEKHPWEKAASCSHSEDEGASRAIVFSG